MQIQILLPRCLRLSILSFRHHFQETPLHNQTSGSHFLVPQLHILPFNPTVFWFYKSSEWQMVRDSAVQSDLVVSSMFAPARGPRRWLSWESRPAGWHWGGSLRCSWFFFVGDLVTCPENSDFLYNDFWLYKNKFLSPLLLLPLCALPLPLQLAVPAQPAPVEISPNQDSLAKIKVTIYTKKSPKVPWTQSCTSEFRVSISHHIHWWVFSPIPTGWSNCIHQQGLHLGRAFSASSILRSSSCRRLSWSILTVFL